MTISNSKIIKYKQWEEHCRRLQNGQKIITETKAEQTARIEKARKDYNFFVKTYFPHIAKCDSAKFHIDAANYLLHNPTTRAVFEWARGHAKSTHMGVFIPLWLKIQKNKNINCVVLVSKSQDSAEKLLADLQEQLAFNDLYINDFGNQIKKGNWAEGEFTTQDGTFFKALGRGQSPRGLKKNGNRPDYIIIDDIADDELCRNEKRVSDVVEWCLTALFGTMAMGRGRFVLVGNRIAKNDIVAQISSRPHFYHTVVNAIDKNGFPSWKENYTLEEIEMLRETVGERNFQKEYMNNPMTEGAVFKEKDIVFGEMKKELREYRQLICYTDPSFKDSTKNDYKATVLVGKTKDGYFHVIKAFADQCNVKKMVDWHYEILRYVAGKVPIKFYIEANFIQDLLLDEFTKTGIEYGLHIPIIPDKRKKPDKFARVEALQPLFERNLVIFNKGCEGSPGFNILKEQLLLFQRGSRIHDDAPDALEAAIWLLSKKANIEQSGYRFQQRPSRRY